jgi:hypothetical protein
VSGPGEALRRSAESKRKTVVQHGGHMQVNRSTLVYFHTCWLQLQWPCNDDADRVLLMRQLLLEPLLCLSCGCCASQVLI